MGGFGAVWKLALLSDSYTLPIPNLNESSYELGTIQGKHQSKVGHTPINKITRGYNARLKISVLNPNVLGITSVTGIGANVDQIASQTGQQNKLTKNTNPQYIDENKTPERFDQDLIWINFCNHNDQSVCNFQSGEQIP